MRPMAHSRAVQTATAVVSAETARATIRATDMIIAMPPRLKMEIRPHNCRREMLRLRRRKKGRRKTEVREGGGGSTHEIGDDVCCDGGEEDGETC